MTRDRSADRVAFVMAIRRLELKYGLYLHTDPEWSFLSDLRPPCARGIFAVLTSPDVAAALEKEVDAEPRYEVRPS